MTHPRSGPAALRPTRLLASAAVLALASVACSPAASPSASPGQSGNPTSGPTAAPTVAGIEHPTGAKDIVLRFESGGGFVPIEWNATNAPSFTLYGDGTVVFRDANAPQPNEGGNVTLLAPFMTINIGESGIQALLAEALNQGGLAAAAGPYMGLGADIPTATFTVNAGGKTKQVSVVGLSPDMHPQNVAIVTQLAHLGDTLTTFADEVDGEQVYTPAAYRGVLLTMDQPFGPILVWPWPDVVPADFTGGENEFFKTRAMSPAEVQALGLTQVTGGMSGLTLKLDGKFYSFALRPLLPDEAK